MVRSGKPQYPARDRSHLSIWTNTDAGNIGPVDSITSTVGLNFYQFQDASIPLNNVVTTLASTNQGLTATLLGRYGRR